MGGGGGGPCITLDIRVEKKQKDYPQSRVRNGKKLTIINTEFLKDQRSGQMSNKLNGQCREIFMAFLNMYGDILDKQGTYSIQEQTHFC